MTSQVEPAAAHEPRVEPGELGARAGVLELGARAGVVELARVPG